MPPVLFLDLLDAGLAAPAAVESETGLQRDDEDTETVTGRAAAPGEALSVEPEAA
jgi:hypothetical protein